MALSANTPAETVPAILSCPSQVMEINPKDTVLTLTSGGCNALNLLVQGAGQVRS
mgnify:CR=1 FL=1